MENMLDRLNRPPAEAWRPRPGDSLVGQLVEIDSRTTEYGAYPILTIKTGDGAEVCFHAYHSVAKSELARRRPVVGDTIGIRFLGKPAGKEYQAYKIIVESAQPQAAAVDWDTMGMEAAAEDTSGDAWWPADDAPAVAPATSGEPPF